MSVGCLPYHWDLGNMLHKLSCTQAETKRTRRSDRIDYNNNAVKDIAKHSATTHTHTHAHTRTHTYTHTRTHTHVHTHTHTHFHSASGFLRPNWWTVVPSALSISSSVHLSITHPPPPPPPPPPHLSLSSSHLTTR